MEEIVEKNLEVCLTITLEEQILMIQHSDPELRDLIQIFRKDPCDRTVGEQNRINDYSYRRKSGRGARSRRYPPTQPTTFLQRKVQSRTIEIQEWPNIVGELHAGEADQNVSFHLCQLVDCAFAQLGFQCPEVLLLDEVWAELQHLIKLLIYCFYHCIRTISRRLVANGLHSCRPLRRLPLTPPNRRQRLEWCRARSTCMTEWHRVVFSDESRFCLSSDSRRVRVWRRRGERSNPAAIVERPTVRQRGIMVWGAIAYDSRSPLLRIQGTMTAQRYVDDVLRPVTLPYLQGVPNALYQQDNARPHTARISQQALQDVQMLPWPPYSPDLSPIEHVWDIIGRRLHALPQPRSEDELWQMVEREWRAIPLDAIRTLIDSLPRRVAACIAVRGGPTCY
ncbi:Transposase [Cordylochernes scorpioides]|uniref:Transposase n=1 Tax=Cordylochernes scorpioides TaxID=51811 RepID=A0ABY6L2E2_9ARAC|nr:Transposase [Cordylochernes scorpioides]